jgi:hypothetical protein
MAAPNSELFSKSDKSGLDNLSSHAGLALYRLIHVHEIGLIRIWG